MLTRPNGYPLESWGRDGYGHACADEACVRTLIDRVAANGARILKLALGDDGLDPRSCRSRSPRPTASSRG